MGNGFERFSRSARTALLAGAFGLAAIAPAAAETVTVGVVAKLALSWPLYAAIEKGMFAQADIKPDIVVTGGSAKSAQQLVAKSVHVGEAGLPDHIRAIQQGAPLKIVAYEVSEAPYRMFARKEIKSVAELKGKTVMIGGSKDVTLIYLEALVKPAGLKPADFNLVYAGATSARFAALSAGGVDATVLLAPFDFAAASQGYTDLGSVHKALPGFPFSAWAVNESWASENRATLVRFLKAYQQGIAWLYDSKNKAEAIDILVKASGAKPDDIARTYDSWIGDIRAFPKDGAMPKEGFDRMLAAIAELGDLPTPPPPMSKFVDDSYLKAAISAK